MFSKAVVSASRLCFQPTGQLAVLKIGQSKFSTSIVHGIKYKPVPKMLAEKMKQFQVDNGLPVHFKGGPVDRILYILTATVCAIGVFDCFRVYYVLSYPQVKSN